MYRYFRHLILNWTFILSFYPPTKVLLFLVYNGIITITIGIMVGFSLIGTAGISFVAMLALPVVSFTGGRGMPRE